MDNREVINDVLVNLFNEILRLEEEAIITDKYKDISNNDMHIIEAVGLGGGNMSSIAAKQKIRKELDRLWKRKNRLSAPNIRK